MFVMGKNMNERPEFHNMYDAIFFLDSYQIASLWKKERCRTPPIDNQVLPNTQFKPRLDMATSFSLCTEIYGPCRFIAFSQTPDNCGRFQFGHPRLPS